mmetsp:Transcript_6402/g.8105  ORF Transcript_6402/g.8105 Transcript_6402/m.8105 type:complete len:394 (+) Transcript_6402:318-1499(+)
MKFLENDKLAQLTLQMTDAKVGTGECSINGRIEAFTMKRAGTDKKLAHALGEKYQAEIQVVESELAEYQKTIEKRRSESLGSELESTLSLMRKSLLPPQPVKAPLSPSSRKRVRIDTKPGRKVTLSRRRSNSTPSSLPLSEDHKGVSKMVSALRSRSDSFDPKSIITLPFANSPLGDFHNSCTQRLMTNLILTLNSSFPDYDFSNIRPSHFARLPSSSVAVNRTNEKLSELAASSQQGTNFLPQLWNSIDDAIGLNDSEVYSYVPPHRDDDDDPLGFLTQTLDGGADSDTIVPLWTLNFFFVNKSMKRIVLFTCVQTMCNEIVSSSDDEDNEFESLSYEVNDMLNSNHNNRRGGRLFAGGDHYEDEEEEEDNSRDFDMDLDGIGQAAPPATVV